jgi:hypothetical protein
MSKRELIRKEIDTIYVSGTALAVEFQKNEAKQFSYDYQSWYTKALKAVSSLAPDRYLEFKGYYEIDPKRKALGYGTYVIQDFIKGVTPSKYQYPEFDSRAQALQCFFNQLTILKAVADRIDSVVNNIEGELYAELQDSELVIAALKSKRTRGRRSRRCRH